MARAALQVAVVGAPPAWWGELVEGPAAPVALVESPEHADVVHVRGARRRGGIRGLRRESGLSGIVVDWSDRAAPPGGSELREAAAADVVLVGSDAALERLARRHRALAARTLVFPPPLDGALAAAADLEGSRRLARFVRYHRLAGPTILFDGPYTPAGGLDRLIDVFLALRDRVPELRLAAVPYGEIDRRFLDACEATVLAAGHHATVRWTRDEDEIPSWYAAAAVVCVPARALVPLEAARLAAAAGRTFVGTTVPPAPDLVEAGVTGHLCAPDDVETLAATLAALTLAEDERTVVGELARARAETEWTARRSREDLWSIWSTLAAHAERRGRGVSRRVGRGNLPRS